MVFYLKYRPKKISELDSLELREKLEAVLKNRLPDDIPHAFLFTGPRGLGKTSTGRILAKAINCTNRKEGEIEPCNTCNSCKSINTGVNLDVLEIDAASNRGIDEIRDLREKIKLAPFSSKKKIYIIDEVHMLTSEAFNALLKTLEEPPAHAYFILCTTEPAKIPETIASRCFHIKFTKATDQDLISSFTRIAKGEKLAIEKNALTEIARLSDGSFRDGAKILEELSTHSSKIDQTLIEKYYKTQSINNQIDNLVKALSQMDTKSAIGVVGQLAKEGTDFKIFTENLINYLHLKLIAQVNGEDFVLPLARTKELIERLASAHMSIKYAVLPQLPLELAIVEWCVEPEKEIVSPGPKTEALGGEQKAASAMPKKDKAPETPVKNNILEDLIASLKTDNFSIAGVLRGCKFEKFDNKELIISTGFKFHKERLADKKVVDLIEKKLHDITNENIKFTVS